MKTRFCPSPTGLMHLGNVRTALFNYLAAMSQGGSFLLRIEDTDKTRSYTEYTDMMLEDLRWLNIAWQEGPEVSAGNAGSNFGGPGPQRAGSRQNTVSFLPACVRPWFPWGFQFPRPAISGRAAPHRPEAG